MKALTFALLLIGCGGPDFSAAQQPDPGVGGSPVVADADPPQAAGGGGTEARASVGGALPGGAAGAGGAGSGGALTGAGGTPGAGGAVPAAGGSSPASGGAFQGTGGTVQETGGAAQAGGAGGLPGHCGEVGHAGAPTSADPNCNAVVCGSDPACVATVNRCMWADFLPECTSVQLHPGDYAAGAWVCPASVSDVPTCIKPGTPSRDPSTVTFCCAASAAPKP